MILLALILVLVIFLCGVRLIIFAKDARSLISGMGIIVLLIVVVFTQTTTTTETFEYEIENIGKIKELVKKRDYAELEKLDIYYTEDKILHAQPISDCNIVYGDEYHYQREVKIDLMFTIPLNRFTTCELMIKNDE